MQRLVEILVGPKEVSQIWETYRGLFGSKEALNSARGSAGGTDLDSDPIATGEQSTQLGVGILGGTEIRVGCE